MPILTNIGLILIGFILLVKGGDCLVDGAVAIAKRAKLSSMVIGLTIVGFGTSAPELLVSVQAALADSPGIAIGNVVGSNIANIGLILGVTAIIMPCASNRQTLRIDMPFMVLVCLLLALVGMSGTIERWQGIIAVLMLISFVSWQIWNARKNNVNDDEQEENVMPIWKAAIMVVASIAALSYGADWLVIGAKGLARMANVSERMIGLTVVSVGTSLPELFASVMAAKKGETDMAIGNIIGSVTFNVLSVIGFAAIICPIANTNVGFFFDYSLMVIMGVILWIFLSTKYLLERWEGVSLLLIYIMFLARTIMYSQV